MFRHTVKRLSTIISEIVKASPQYLEKEKVRQALQEMITARVGEGLINNQEELDEFFATVNMASKSLKMIPFSVYKKLAA